MSQAPLPSRFVAILRIEKQGRGGKTVTVIAGLPKVNVFLREGLKLAYLPVETGGMAALSLSRILSIPML
jgi:hypothetical protein